MISFVWSSEQPLLADAGGAETYTIGQIRELIARGIPAEVVTVGYGSNDGRQDSPDIPFRNLSLQQVAQLDTTVIFAMNPAIVTTRRQSYVILHTEQHRDPFRAAEYLRGITGKIPIVTSKAAARAWGKVLNRDPRTISIAYPFADEAFSQVTPSHKDPNHIRVIFASRLTPQKGIYTYMAATQLEYLLDGFNFIFTATTAGAHTPIGQTTKRLLDVFPNIQLIPSRKNPHDMAELLASQDILVFPSNAQYWSEPFGMLSVEAQKAGCRVVASNDGGLPETDCGGLLLVEPDNAAELAKGLVKAAKLGRLSQAERQKAAKKFTVQQSVDSLLAAINYRTLRPPK